MFSKFKQEFFHLNPSGSPAASGYQLNLRAKEK
jgi:hypothetical protein